MPRPSRLMTHTKAKTAFKMKSNDTNIKFRHLNAQLIKLK